MSSEPPVEQQPDPLEPEETVEGVPVLAAQVRALEPARRQLPAARAAAVAATGFVAGAAAVAAIHHQVVRRKAVRPARRRGAAGEKLTVLGTRSFLLDVHVLGRE